MSVFTPTFDKNIPVPRKGPCKFKDPGASRVVGYEWLGVSELLAFMEVGDSCLLTNWASTPVHYTQKKLGYRFQRQLQPDGSVRIWRTQ